MAGAHRVIIIGAGLAGLSAAGILSTGPEPLDVVVIDKGRGVGGRLATRRLGDATLDHGAQFFTVRSDRFRAAVDQWIGAGVVEEWCQGFGETDGYPRYRVAGGMNQLAKHLATEMTTGSVNIITRNRVGAIIPGPDQWAVTYEGFTREPDEADAVIATPPVPQTLELLKSGATMVPAELAPQLEAMRYHMAIAVLTVLDRSPELPHPGALQRPDHPIFSFVADNEAKGISSAPAVTFHLSHQLSAELFDNDDGEVLTRIEQEIRATIGQAAVKEIQVKRWRYTGPVEPFPESTALVASMPGPLVLAGDGFGGSKVEGAFLSGVAAAEQVLDMLG